MLKSTRGRSGRRIAAGMLAAATAAYAADGPGVLEQQLTGGSSRAWTLQEFARPSVAGDACTTGATYTFAATHDLLVTRCQAGQLVASHHPWSARSDGQAAVLELGGIGTYELLIEDARPGPHRLRLHATGVLPGWPAGDVELQAGEN